MYYTLVKLKLNSSGRLVGFLVFLILTVFELALDSSWLGQRFAYGQILATGATLAYFLYTYRYRACPRLKRLMLIGLLVGLAGEVSFSLVLHMYEYRLQSIPLYVPPGHAILYAQAYMFVRNPWTVRHAAWLKIAMFGLACSFSLSWLILRQDLYGFGCFGIFVVLLLFNPASRLFFLTMYLLVAYLELLGTGFGCWSWPPALLNRWPLITSANPPSSISIFYIGFDISCLLLYLLLKPRYRKRYREAKAYRDKQAHQTKLELS